MKIETNVTIDVGAGNQPLALTMQEALELADAIYKALGIKIPSVITYPSNGLTPRAYPSPFVSPVATYGAGGQEHVLTEKFELRRDDAELRLK